MSADLITRRTVSYIFIPYRSRKTVRLVRLSETIPYGVAVENEEEGLYVELIFEEPLKKVAMAETNGINTFEYPLSGDFCSAKVSRIRCMANFELSEENRLMPCRSDSLSSEAESEDEPN